MKNMSINLLKRFTGWMCYKGNGFQNSVAGGIIEERISRKYGWREQTKLFGSG
jgi:hypothetical protein